MCDFMAINSAKPFLIDDFLAEVVKRRKEIRENEHGWGFFFDDGKNKVIIKEPLPAWKSPFFLWFEEKDFDVTAYTFILHVRKAVIGKISWFNTHPFMRNVGNKTYVFAHKGNVEKSISKVELKEFKPMGETDSERFFLYLLEQIKNRSLPESIEEIKDLVDNLAFENKLNFFLYDGEYLLVYDGSDDEPLYYYLEPGFFMATSEQFRRTEMGEIGKSVLLLVKDGEVIKRLVD
ncbi:MAG: class II glutamine amidotransferase [Candidatus Njordarchaeia archaeon]